jgi:SAM-dependent methyltransferase
VTRAPTSEPIVPACAIDDIVRLLSAEVAQRLASCRNLTAIGLLEQLAVEPLRLHPEHEERLAACRGPIVLRAGSPRVELDVLAAWQATTTTARCHEAPAGIHVLCGRACVARLKDDEREFELVGEGESAVLPLGRASHCAAARGGVRTVVVHVSDGVRAQPAQPVRWSFDPVALHDYYWGYDERYAAVYEAGAELWENAEPNGSLVAFMDRFTKLGPRVLDLGCGEGRDSLFLARRGLAVTGVDVSRTALDRARDRATADGLDCTFLERDVIYLRNLEGPFDWAINMGCLHMLDDDGARAAHLTRVRELLVPGGMFLVSHCMRDWGRGFYSVPHYRDLGSLRPGMRTQRRIRIGEAEGHVELVELPYRESSSEDLCDELSSAGFEILERLTEDTYAFGNAAVIAARRPVA